jgi:hypothetical protein
MCFNFLMSLHEVSIGELKVTSTEKNSKGLLAAYNNRSICFKCEKALHVKSPLYF